MNDAPRPLVPPGPAAAPPRLLHVAFVTETFPPEINGVATTTACLVDGLLRRGHRVQLVRPRQPADTDAAGARRGHEVLVAGLPIPMYPQLRMGRPCGRRLRRLWSQQRPDVVHVATEGPLGWSALRSARALGVAVTSDFRTNFHAYSHHYGLGWMSRAIAAALRGFHNRAERTLVPTDALRRELAAAGFERLHVVPRGVDTVQFTPAFRSQALRRSWGAGPDDVVIGSVGRLAAEKNLALVAAAYRCVQRVLPGARLVFVGAGPLREALAAACPDAVFAGQRTGDDLAAHYASFDLFAVASLTETFGNVTAEAMASGQPVVAFDHAAAGQLIRSGDNGWLVPLGDEAGFVARTVALARDPLLRRVLGPRARATALAQGWDDVVARFEQHLRAACAAGTSAAPAVLPSEAAAWPPAPDRRATSV
jgi:glycosyltransferase involved in cell wall biosynthesis